MFSRRYFLATGASSAATALLRRSPSTQAATSAAVSLSTWDGVRSQFRLTEELVHMSGFFLASHPLIVREAIEHYRTRLDSSPLFYVEDNLAGFEVAVRQSAARYLECSPDDLAMTDSTTMGLGTVYTGLNLRQDQEIVTTEHDHFATHDSLRFASKRTGATLKVISLYASAPRATEKEMVDSILRNLSEATRVVAITWVHSSTGVKVPVRAIADAIERINRDRHEDNRILLCVDGVHGFGVEDVNISDLKCDLFIAGCHKWLFGPRGTGLIYGTGRGWSSVRPTIPSFDAMWRVRMASDFPAAATLTPGGFHTFEHRWALSEAFRFHLNIGKKRVAARTHELARHLKTELKRLHHVRLYTPESDEVSSGIVCFDVDGLKPAETVARLRTKKIVASQTPYKPSYARLAPSIINSHDDIEKVVRAIRGLA